MLAWGFACARPAVGVTGVALLAAERRGANAAFYSSSSGVIRAAWRSSASGDTCCKYHADAEVSGATASVTAAALALCGNVAD